MPAGAGSRDIAAGAVHEDIVGPRPDGPSLGWIGPRPFTRTRSSTCARPRASPRRRSPCSRRAPRLTAALEAYLGRRSAARVLAAPLRRDIGETIQAALLYADLRGFTALVRNHPPAEVIAALDAWFDRIAGAVHAFGGEVLKFIGDGVLAIFPVVDGVAAPRLRRGAACGQRAARSRDGASRRGARRARDCRRCVRRRAASRRDTLGQYRRRQPAGFHGDRSRRQSGQPARRIVPAARQGPC